MGCAMGMMTRTYTIPKSYGHPTAVVKYKSDFIYYTRHYSGGVFLKTKTKTKTLLSKTPTTYAHGNERRFKRNSI